MKKQCLESEFYTQNHNSLVPLWAVHFLKAGFLAVCFVTVHFAVRPHVARRFLITQAKKLDFSLPRCQGGEELAGC